MSERDVALKARSFRRDTIAWWVLFSAIAIAVVIHYGWRDEALFTPLPAADDDPRLAILSYDRIVTEADGHHVSAAQLRRQLEALRQAGFNPITIEQLRAFYVDHQGLPRKPLLLFFEHGYSESFENVDPILRELKWHAAMGIQTRRMEDRDTAFVYWRQLAAMVESGLWSVVAQGHNSDLPIATGLSNGGEGEFFSHRAWLEQARRHESDAEFSRRLQADLSRSKALLAQHLENYKVVAFSYPLALAQDRASSDERRLAERVVGGLFDVALVDGLLGINDRAAHRLRLQRLRVDGGLSAPELVRRLEASLQSPVEAPEPYWIVAAGQVTQQGRGLDLEGEPLAATWLAGSQWQSHWQIEAEIESGAGQFWFTADSDISTTGWRLGGDGEWLNLQLLEQGEVVQTLASVALGGSGPHRLKLIKRGPGLWIEWDGQPISETPMFLPQRWRRALLGWQSWRRHGVSRLRVADFRFGAYPYRVRAISAHPATAQIQALIGEAPAIAALRYPARVDFDADPRYQQSRQLLQILARRYGWDLIPQPTLAGDGDQPPVPDPDRS